jgi:hypothetical protein
MSDSSKLREWKVMQHGWTPGCEEQLWGTEREEMPRNYSITLWRLIGRQQMKLAVTE